MQIHELIKAWAGAPRDARIHALVDGEPDRLVTRVQPLIGGEKQIAILETVSASDVTEPVETVGGVLRELITYPEPDADVQLYFTYPSEAYAYDEVKEAGTDAMTGAYLLAGDFITGGGF